MNANGLLGSMCFPSFPQFCGQLFMRTPDKDQARAMVEAYNDWHVDEWFGTYPGRFIPLALPILWDTEAMAAEVRRMAAKGCHAVTFSENPAKLGLPSLHSDHWDPFWRACSDEGTVVCLHIGSSSQVVVTAEDAPVDVMITLTPINIVQAAADLIWSPVLRKYPELRIALSEGGIGWIPYFLERIDYVYQHHKAWTGHDFGEKLPSQVFNERIITCFIDDAFGVESRRHLNIDHITWECDYPHSDSTWPQAPELAMKYLEPLSDCEIDKISHLNAMRLWRYDPFAHIPREKCTVGALRAQAAGWDVEIRSSAVLEHAGRGTSTGQFAAMANQMVKG
jgi:predicted TIM-barrel fold metal-dependent hydrolase